MPVTLAGKRHCRPYKNTAYGTFSFSAACICYIADFQQYPPEATKVHPISSADFAKPEVRSQDEFIRHRHFYAPRTRCPCTIGKNGSIVASSS